MWAILLFLAYGLLMEVRVFLVLILPVIYGIVFLILGFAWFRLVALVLLLGSTWAATR